MPFRSNRPSGSNSHGASRTHTAGGVLLWKRTPFDDATGLGLLFVGLIVILVALPWLTDAPFVPLDLVVVAVTGIVCFLPLALCRRAARSR